MTQNTQTQCHLTEKRKPPTRQKSSHISLCTLFNGPDATQVHQINQKHFFIPNGFQPSERPKHPKHW